MIRKASRPPIFLPQHPRAHRSDHRPHQPDKDGQAQCLRRQGKHLRQLLGSSCDYGRIESEQKTAQRSDGRSLHQVTIQILSGMQVRFRYESETLHAACRNRQQKCICLYVKGSVASVIARCPIHRASLGRNGRIENPTRPDRVLSSQPVRPRSPQSSRHSTSHPHPAPSPSYRAP